MSWHAVGTERGEEPRRLFDISWVDGSGPVAAPGSEWALDALRAMDGEVVDMPPVGPAFVLDLADPSLTYWALMSMAWDEQTTGRETITPLPGSTPPGAVN